MHATLKRYNREIDITDFNRSTPIATLGCFWLCPTQSRPTEMNESELVLLWAGLWVWTLLLPFGYRLPFPLCWIQSNFLPLVIGKEYHDKMLKKLLLSFCPDKAWGAFAHIMAVQVKQAAGEQYGGQRYWKATRQIALSCCRDLVCNCL